MRPARSQFSSGSALIAVIVYLMIVTTMTAAFFGAVHRSLSLARTAERQSQSQLLAEAGVEKALAELRARPAEYRGEQDTPLGAGAFSVVVTPGPQPGAYRIVARGRGDRGSALGAMTVQADVALAGGRISQLHWMEASHR